MKFFFRIALVVVMLAWGLQPTLAQDADSPSDEGAGFFGIGSSIINIGELNDRLEGAGYPTFPRAMLAVGGGGYGVYNDVLMIGGEGYGLFSGENAYQGRSVSMGGGYGFFNLGYMKRLTPRLRVYPMLGLGGGGLNLNIGSEDGGSFDDVLRNPNREATLMQGRFLMSLSAGAEYRVGGIRIGLRAGYVLAPYTTSWRLDGDPLADSPDASLAGPFVHLLILP